MTWVKIDDNAPHHPKLRRVGPEAAWLWVAGLAHCNRFTTDGRIDDLDLDALYPFAHWDADRLRRLAKKLVDVGLWTVTDGGWMVHDYAEFQGEAMRSARDERRKWEADRKARQRANAKAERAALSSHGRPEVVGDAGKQAVPDSMSQWDRGGTGVGQSPGTTLGQHSGTTAGQTPDVSHPSRPVPSRPEQKSEEETAVPAVTPPGVPPSGSSPSGEGAKKAAPRKPKATPRPDSLPLPGTPARAVYDALVSNPVLVAITGNPGEFATEITDPDIYPGVNVLAEVKKACGWSTDNPGEHTDGRRFLRNWLGKKADRVAALPRPHVPAPFADTPARREPTDAELRKRTPVALAERNQPRE